ncbi:MAG: thioredoxin domain-containing protein, partial [Thermoanaerobaculia bacterium]
DDIYMTAVQMMTGSGGWPLSLFLTPEGKPFYGGTYFPPDGRSSRPGFVTLLTSIRDAWQNRREDLEASAAEMLGHLSVSNVGTAGIAGGKAPGIQTLEAATRSFEAQFDPVHGGFGGAPKFPPAMRLELLIRRFIATKDASARRMAETTLAKMAAGGMYDQVGGGFHRYSTDATWLVPHFEKMLYDNAMLARVYVLAHRAFGTADHARVAQETLDYLLKEMTPEGGGFFSAQDADSEGEEGAFYVWNPAALEAAVGAAAAPLVAARFGVTPEGNFEDGRTVLSIRATVPELSSRFGRSETEIATALARARDAMYEARAKRVWPGTDDKLLTDWTALAISALALGGRVLGSMRYLAAGRLAADRILERCRRGPDLYHRQKQGEAGIPGFASDYACFIEALLDLYEATFTPRYVRAALELERAFEQRFADANGGFFFSAPEHDGLILRPKETMDGATPSSNSVAAMNLLRLASLTGDAVHREKAEAILQGSSGTLERAPAALPRLLCALDFATGTVREVVLSGEPGRPDFEALREAVFASPGLNRVLVH